MKRVLAFLLALVIATAGAVGILLVLQSLDGGTIDRTVSTPQTQTVP